MVFFREDLVSRMRRHCILPLSDEMTELSEHVLSFIVVFVCTQLVLTVFPVGKDGD